MDQTERAISSADLLTLAGGATEWLVDQRLPRPGASVLAGTPGVGKRALARDLAVAAARGATWLGFPAAKGRVLYARLAEFAKLRSLFRQGGLAPEDEIYFIDAERPGSRLERIHDYAKSLEPALIIIDGLDQLRQEDAHYRRSDDSLMLDRILHAAGECGAHVLMIHDIVDSLAGDLNSFITDSNHSLDTILMLSRSGGDRVLRTVQRRGMDLLDGITLPGEANAEATGDLEAQILAYLRRSERLADRKEIAQHLPGIPERETHTVVTELHRRGELIRTGSGTRADPYRYTGFDRLSNSSKPHWLRRVRPWARVGKADSPFRGLPTEEKPEESAKLDSSNRS